MNNNWEHISFGYSVSTIWAFYHRKQTYFMSRKRLKKFCESLREHRKNAIDFSKKKMLPFTKEEFISHQGTKVFYICGKRILKNPSKSINYRKVRDHCHYARKYRSATHSICNLKFNMSNQILVVFHNDSNYDYHFIIKGLANEFEWKFECLEENTVKST